jgi:hypothetical protein
MDSATKMPQARPAEDTLGELPSTELEDQQVEDQYPHPFHWRAEEYYSDEYKETPRTVSAGLFGLADLILCLVDRTQNVRGLCNYSRETQLVDQDVRL